MPPHPHGYSGIYVSCGTCVYVVGCMWDSGQPPARHKGFVYGPSKSLGLLVLTWNEGNAQSPAKRERVLLLSKSSQEASPGWTGSEQDSFPHSCQDMQHASQAHMDKLSSATLLVSSKGPSRAAKTPCHTGGSRCAQVHGHPSRGSLCGIPSSSPRMRGGHGFNAPPPRSPSLLSTTEALFISPIVKLRCHLIPAFLKTFPNMLICVWFGRELLDGWNRLSVFLFTKCTHVHTQSSQSRVL